MNYNANSVWTVTIDVEKQLQKKLYYRYVIESGTYSDFEYGKMRSVSLETNHPSIRVIDSWKGRYGSSVFDSVAFSKCYFKRKPISGKKKQVQEDGNLTIRLNCSQMEPDRHFAIIGNQPELGYWDVSKKIRMDESDYPVWSISLDASRFTFPLEFKFLIVDTKSDVVLAWGGGPNRIVESVDENSLNIFTEENFLRTIPSWRAAGVAIPVFSLRTETDFGIGEFLDLKLMIDWARRTNQKIIQTLPINDTILYHSNYDSYPYNAVSVYALHPVYLNLERLGTLKNKKLITYFKKKKNELNAKKFSDYQNVMNAKWEYFKEIYPQESPAVFASKEYKQFFEKNKEWLVPYAAFSYLRDLNGTPEFGKWKEFGTYNKEEIERFSAPDQPHFQDIALFYYLQFHLHLQLSEVHDYARKNGVAIKGDIPIGVSPRSVDAWIDPDLFNTHVQAGAPPDDFSATGQNWGFPTYNWEGMEKKNYSWWKKRFQKLSEYFDAYRIDHILGFFRIWEIPESSVWGLNGAFNPALPYTRHELETMGLRWDENRFLKPFLREHVLYSAFGKYTDEVIREYFDTDGWQNFKFKPQFDTQRKVETYFSNLGYDFGNKEVLIRDGLYALHCEVLFLRDIHQPDKFHPRISMHSSATFRDLNDETRRLLDRVYVDYFYHRHTDFWKQQALKKLPALISSTDMLVCGEDLGMVPDSVPAVMNELEILSLEIQRMPKKTNTEFAMPADAPYCSVCTTSTHDMNPIRAWWEEDESVTQRFYNKALGMQGPAPASCDTWISERIVEQHLYSPAMLVILPLQDWLSIDAALRFENPLAERINVPSNPRNFWCYRIHLTLEELLKADRFNKEIGRLVAEAGR